jgi:hypothetical protein
MSPEGHDADVTKPDDQDLGRRLRANRGRHMRPGFTARIERALGRRVDASDVLDLVATDGLSKALAVRLKAEPPTRTWPESQRREVFDHLKNIGGTLDPAHVSYLTYFEGWEELGALRLHSAAVCAQADSIWEESAEPLCLLATDLKDGLFLDYTEPAQMHGADEYELWIWGAFARAASKGRD